MKPLEQLRALLPRLEEELSFRDYSTFRNLAILLGQEVICDETWVCLINTKIPNLKDILHKTDTYSSSRARKYFEKAISLVEQLTYKK